MLLTGGVHGDEYEGPIAVSRLAQALKPEQIQGRVIMMPAVNVPAVMNDTRLSPIDDRDLNRCFPGDPRGIVLGNAGAFHGQRDPAARQRLGRPAHGRPFGELRSRPTCTIFPMPRCEKTMAAAAAFGAPFNVVFWGVDEGATLTSCVERREIISIGTELGGWGRVNVEGVRIGERGVRNMMKHFGIMQGKPETVQRDGSPATRHMMVKDAVLLHLCAARRLVRAAARGRRPGSRGRDARVSCIYRGCRHAPPEVKYGASGTLWMAAGPGRVQRGDCVAVVMQDYDEPAAACG